MHFEDEMETVLDNDKNFMGCYASNQLPTVPLSFPKSLIINTATIETGGEHWVAIVLHRKQCFYFDSFGI